MTPNADIPLHRDCDAIEIPAGRPARLSRGTPVQITQTLGGNYTVAIGGQLYRISDRDADALGLERSVTAGGGTTEAASARGVVGSVEELEKEIWETLRTCFDPEIPVNIVDLGLVYDLQIDQLPGGKRKAQVKMTLTAPGCGMGGVIAGDAQAKLLGLPGLDDADVELVWDPPWHPSMISASGRKALGLE